MGLGHQYLSKVPLESLVHSQNWKPWAQLGLFPQCWFLHTPTFFPGLAISLLWPIRGSGLGCLLVPLAHVNDTIVFQSNSPKTLPPRPSPQSRCLLGPPERRCDQGGGEAGGSDRQKANSSKGWQAAFYSSLISTPFKPSLGVLLRKINVLFKKPCRLAPHALNPS